MYAIDYTKRFKKDLQRCQKRGLDIGLVAEAVSILQKDGKLPASYKPHKLKGNHTGTHSDLFKK